MYNGKTTFGSLFFSLEICLKTDAGIDTFTIKNLFLDANTDNIFLLLMLALSIYFVNVHITD